MVIQTVTDIANHALAMIGEYEISSYDSDPSHLGDLCRRFYPSARDELLQQYEWSFAVKRAKLSRLSETPLTGHTCAYQLPADLLHLIKVTNTTMEYRVEAGGKLLTDADTVYIRYIARIEDPRFYSPMFSEALAAYLASKLAIPVTGSTRLKTDIQATALVLLHKAMGRDLQGGAEPDPGSDLWTEVL